ncbi:Crp/Fnr family transcriptional regulator [Micromonospora matsumotoense]|uniref:Crp/Fnr family transcriptional regulator n=1 Tax=Micromonospora matsumotoense TaxID=121616 RepID=UPI0033F54F0E
MSSRTEDANRTPAWWSRASFAGRLSDADRAALLRIGGRQEFPSTHPLIRQGDRGRHLLLLTTGQARIMVEGSRRGPQGIALRYAGDLVGELSYLDDGPRSASVVAVGPVVVRHIPAEAFDHYLRRHPAAHRPFARLLADRLRAADKRTVTASYDTITRVAAVLADLTVLVDDELVAHTTQRELAQLAGASQISVHRALRRLSQLGLLATRHGSIVIVDEVGLGRVADSPAAHIT